MDTLNQLELNLYNTVFINRCGREKNLRLIVNTLFYEFNLNDCDIKLMLDRYSEIRGCMRINGVN